MSANLPAPSVSENNPCPFLRALVAGGHLSDETERVSELTDTILRAGGETLGYARFQRFKIYLIALIANGMSPAKLARTADKGVRLNELRSGPLDKCGVGSRILDNNARFDERQFLRLDEYAAHKIDGAGKVERGLGTEQLCVMMNANFARSAGNRRKIDRALMNGEWPILLRVMGKDSMDGAYLSLTELRSLFADCRLPDRITIRLNVPPQP